MNKQKNNLRRKQGLDLILIFSCLVFAIFIVSSLCVAVMTYVLVHTGALPIVEKDMPQAHRLILFMAISSVLIGFVLFIIPVKVILKPVNRLIEHMNCLAAGDYSVRMKFGKPFGEFSVTRMVSDSFNRMASELENTEVLRADFINNFSHEFKTPIVSIAGFAKLLKREELTPQQRKEYINIIEEESLRLSYMATNVLNLTRVENQTILTDVSVYNLSEQLRFCVLLLEDKWTNKKLDLYLDFGEYEIAASEELLKHVWINLLDNAIKFSPEYGVVEIKIKEEQALLEISISNNGKPIAPENYEKIFNKFYQEDESHSSAGNGIGLAIVKRVAELHNGTVYVKSKPNQTTFTVKLPKVQ